MEEIKGTITTEATINGEVATERAIEGRLDVAGIGGGGNVDDVQINGTSIVVDNVANIPYASEGVYGVTTVTDEALAEVDNRLSEEITEINNDIKTNIPVGEVPITLQWNIGSGAYSLTGNIGGEITTVETSNNRYAIVEIVDGEVYKYSGEYTKKTTLFVPIIFVDAFDKVVGFAFNDAGKNIHEEIRTTTLTVPNSAVKMYINSTSIGTVYDSVLTKSSGFLKINELALNNKARIDNLSDDFNPTKTEVKSTIADGQSILFDEKIGVRKNVCLMFNATIESFNRIYIGYTPSGVNNGVKYIGIDGTNLLVYGNTGRVDETYAHGLSIQNNISVIMDCNNKSKCKVTILSNGNMYQKEVTLIPYPLTAPYMLSDGSTLKDVRLSVCYKDINKDIWVFGDSYMDILTNRWVYYLIDNGYSENVFLSSVAGSTSSDAIISLVNMLKHGKPKYIVWCMGMNDGSDSGNTPSADWKNKVDSLIDTCTQKNITLILATIPNVPNISHLGKNAYVKSSGYRYIDFAKAVGADTSSTWYADMLGNDNVHPTTKGALALYGEAITDFPEFAIL